MTLIDTLVFTGHRDKITDTETLIHINNAYPGCTWWHGGADGFDTQINRFCLAHGISVQYILPDYDTYTPNVAPLRRNDKLLLKIKESKNGGILFACYDGRQKGGTFYTINHARIASPPIQVVLVPVVVIEPQNRHYYVSTKTNNNRTRPRNATR